MSPNQAFKSASHFSGSPRGRWGGGEVGGWGTCTGEQQEVDENRDLPANGGLAASTISRASGFAASWVVGFVRPRFSRGSAWNGKSIEPPVLDDQVNLSVADSIFFPSISAVNPSLTIMAIALRVGVRIAARLASSER